MANYVKAIPTGFIENLHFPEEYYRIYLSVSHPDRVITNQGTLQYTIIDVWQPHSHSEASAK